MNDLRFRYCYVVNGKKELWFFTIQEIEQGKTQPYTLISRDQFIGLQDKDGTKIYENDIVQNFYGRDHVESRCVVRWYKKEWRLMFVSKECFNQKSIFRSHVTNISSFEGGKVIGNFFMEPELLIEWRNK